MVVLYFNMQGKVLLSIQMVSVVCLHASMQKEHILQHTIVFLPSVIFVEYHVT